MSNLREQAYFENTMKDRVDEEYYDQYKELFPDIDLPGKELEELDLDDDFISSEAFIMTVLESYMTIANEVLGVAYRPPNITDIEEKVREEYEQFIADIAESTESEEDTYDDILESMSEIFMIEVSEGLTDRIYEVLDTAGFAYTAPCIGTDFRGEQVRFAHCVENSSAKGIFEFEFVNILERGNEAYEQGLQEGYYNLLYMRLE